MTLNPIEHGFHLQVFRIDTAKAFSEVEGVGMLLEVPVLRGERKPPRDEKQMDSSVKISCKSDEQPEGYLQRSQ